jgi:membrane-associated phospholipid phosphatase
VPHGHGPKREGRTVDMRGSCKHSILPTVTIRPQELAHALTNALNPFVIFTALFALAAFAEAGAYRGVLYLAVELTAGATVAGYVLFMRRRSRVGDFWISVRAERLTPAVFLLAAFVALLAALVLLEAPQNLTLLTFSMGLASAGVAGITLLWKASAHCTVAGHAAAAGLLLLGPLGFVFLLVLPLVLWSRVTLKAHTLSQTLAGAAVGAGCAVLFLA